MFIRCLDPTLSSFRIHEDHLPFRGSAIRLYDPFELRHGVPDGRAGTRHLCVGRARGVAVVGRLLAAASALRLSDR